MKTCPYCAEKIQDEAIVCKHCGRELAPDVVAMVSQGLTRETEKAAETETATEPVESTPRASAPLTEAKPKRPIRSSAVRVAAVLTALYLIYGIAQVVFGRISWDQFVGNLGSAVLIGVMTAIVTTIGIWFWRAISTPLPAEIQAASGGSDEVERAEEEQAADQIAIAADISASEDLADEPSTELSSAEPEGPRVYSIPDGLVAAPSEPKVPVWKRAVGVAGAFAALQSVLLVGVFAFGTEPEFIATLHPVQLILSIPLIFGLAFGITSLAILAWRYATSRSTLY